MKRIIIVFLILFGIALAQGQNTGYNNNSIQSGFLFPFRQGIDTYTAGAASTGTTVKQTSTKPPLHAGRIILESIAGFGGGILGGITLGYIVGRSEPDDPIMTAGPLYGALVGIPLGTATGVYLVGSYGNETGSFGYTLVGSIIGLIGGVLLALKFGGDILPFIIVSVATPVIAFNLTRDFKEEYIHVTDNLNIYHNDTGHYQATSVANNRLYAPTGVQFNIISLIF
jgi:hypothetical protein